MTQDIWYSVLSRLSPLAPVDLDEAPSAPPGRGLSAWPADVQPPSPRLWDRPEDGTSHLGIRVDQAPGDCTSAALRLASAAAERGVIPIILTPLSHTGFERFGFRVERFVDGPGVDRAAWESEISAFWDLALIVDLQDVARLG